MLEKFGNFEEINKKFGDINVELIAKPCPKCGKIVSVIQEVVPIRVKAWILPIITIKFTIQESYHPDCGFSRFEIIELADLQKKVKNWKDINDFLKYTIEKWMKQLMDQESKKK